MRHDDNTVKRLLPVMLAALPALGCLDAPPSCPPGDGLGSWVPLSREGAPSQRHHHLMAHDRARNRVYIWGGAGDDAELADGVFYDVTADTWAPLPVEGAPGPRTQFAWAFTGTRLVVVGGMRRATTSAEVPGEVLADGGILDVTTLTWSPLPGEGAPPPRMRASATAVGERVFVVGGMDAAGNARGDGYVLDLTGTPTWHALRGAPPLALGTEREPFRAEPVFLGHNDLELVAISGLGTGELTMRAASYPLGAGLEPGGPWQLDEPTQAPPARRGGSVVAMGAGRFLVYGGHVPHLDVGDDPRNYLDNGAILTAPPLGGLRWEAIAGVGDVSVPRAFHAAAWTGDALVVVGGSDPGYCGGGALWDFNTRTWSRLVFAGSPKAGRLATSAWTAGGLLVSGGLRPLTQATLAPALGLWRP